MALGQFGKAMAGEALERAKSSMLDSVLPDPKKAAAPAAVAPAAPEPVGSLILAQIQAMQRSLKEDQELVVCCQAAGEALRITEIFVPSPKLLVLSGHDGEQNVTRIIAPAEAVQLVCKVKKVAEGSAPLRINIMTPRPKTDQPG